VSVIRNAIASLAVNDVEASARWYERLFGRPADNRAMPGVLEWQFERGGWLQIYQLPERAGRGSVTFAVSSLDQQIRDLAQSGIAAGEPIRGSQVNVIMIKDPDGNSLAFAESTDSSMAK
jgi:predicted enzyme related to lactoylglutathione lyase